MSRAGSLSGGGVDHRSHQPDPFHQAGVGGGYAPDQASGPGPVPVGAGGGSSSKAGWVVVALVLVALAVVGYIIYASAT